MSRALRCFGIGVIAWLFLSQSVQAQKSWVVYMRNSPCAETLRDWMTVSDTQQGGFEVARTPRGSAEVTFPATPAGFTAAQAMADALRLTGFVTAGNTGQQAKYQSYCCATWSVWSKMNPDGTKTFATVRGQDKPSSFAGFSVERGNMCCEDAAAMANLPGGQCSLYRLSNGRVVRFTSNGPVSLGPPIMVGGTIIPTGTPGQRPSRACDVHVGRWKVGENPTHSGVVSASRPCSINFTEGNRAISITKMPSNGTLKIEGRRWTYQPNDGYTGVESFSFLFTYPSGKTSHLTYELSVI